MLSRLQPLRLARLSRNMSSKPNADWNPDQYLRFAKERKQPFVDLVSLACSALGQGSRPSLSVVDIG